MEKKKSFFRRLLNFKIIFTYLHESVNVVKQGASAKDKLILFIYYLRLPVIIIKSLFTRKEFRQLEEPKKFLIGDVTLRNKDGIFFCSNNIMAVYTASDTYEKHLYPYIDLESGVFIDVGAHIGKHSVRLGKNVNNKVIAIEPEKNNFRLLEKNINLNKLANVITINKGVFSSRATLPFYLADKGEGSHSLFAKSSECTSIPVDTLDNIAEELALCDQIKKIKIDVEGAEKDALRGCRRILEKSHPDLVVEILQANKENLSWVINFLHAYRYTWKQLDNDNYYFF